MARPAGPVTVTTRVPLRIVKYSSIDATITPRAPPMRYHFGGGHQRENAPVVNTRRVTRRGFSFRGCVVVAPGGGADGEYSRVGRSSSGSPVYDGSAGEALLPAKGSRAPRSLGALKALRALKSSFESNVGACSAGSRGGGGHSFSSAVGTDGSGGAGKLRGVEGGAERRGADGAALRGADGGTLRGADGGGAALRAVGTDGGGGALLEGGGGGTLRPVICGVGGGGGTRLRDGGGGGLLARDVSGAASAARLGGASAAPPGGAKGALGARLGGGGGAFEPGPRATTPDSDGRLESRLLSESKISSPEPLLLPLMEGEPRDYRRVRSGSIG